MDDVVLVSIDDHSIEPPDMFEQNAPAQYRDLAPMWGAPKKSPGDLVAGDAAHGCGDLGHGVLAVVGA